MSGGHDGPVAGEGSGPRDEWLPAGPGHIPDTPTPDTPAAGIPAPDGDGANSAEGADTGLAATASGTGAAGAAGAAQPNGNSPDGSPGGEVYDWYTRGVALLDRGNANAAVQLLAHAVAAEPGSRSVREALARAQFDAGQYGAARESFAWIVAHDPTDDYAQFGLGMAARRTGDLRAAVEHLALAVAMRPDLGHYGQALRGVRAALNRPVRGRP